MFDIEIRTLAIFATSAVTSLARREKWAATLGASLHLASFMVWVPSAIYVTFLDDSGEDDYERRRDGGYEGGPLIGSGGVPCPLVQDFGNDFGYDED